MPLPTEKGRFQIINDSVEMLVNGAGTKEIPINKIEGIATQSLPNLSVMKPPIGNTRPSTRRPIEMIEAISVTVSPFAAPSKDTYSCQASLTEHKAAAKPPVPKSTRQYLLQTA